MCACVCVPPPCRHFHYNFQKEVLRIPSLPGLVVIHSSSSGLNAAVCTGRKKIIITDNEIVEGGGDSL